MLYAGIDIHKTVFQAVVLDPDTGELSESRIAPSRERLGEWASAWQGKLAAVAIESTTGWRWVARELEERWLQGPPGRSRTRECVAWTPAAPQDGQARRALARARARAAAVGVRGVDATRRDPRECPLLLCQAASRSSLVASVLSAR
jgi:hypothetical protein